MRRVVAPGEFQFGVAGEEVLEEVAENFVAPAFGDAGSGGGSVAEEADDFRAAGDEGGVDAAAVAPGLDDGPEGVGFEAFAGAFLAGWYDGPGFGRGGEAFADGVEDVFA